MARTPAETAAPDKRSSARLVLDRTIALSVLYALALVGLILLRAFVGHVRFISMGWLVVLALVPVLPWLIPAIAPLVARVAPRIQSVTIPGLLEVGLAAARPAAGLLQVEEVLTQDRLAQRLVESPKPFTSTDAERLIDGVRAVRATGADSVVVNLVVGMTWRLPNLYFVAWLITNEPVLNWLVFTESTANTSDVFVGLSSAAEVCAGIEAWYPQYAQVSTGLEYLDFRPSAAGPAPGAPAQSELERTRNEHLAEQFNRIRSQVAPGGGEVPTLAWVKTQKLRDNIHLAKVSVPWSGDIDRATLQKIVRSPAPYVAAVMPDGRFRGLLDQREIVLEFTRRVLEAN